MTPLEQNTTERMEKALLALQREMSRLRTGRASLSILEEVRVDYYGQKVPLNQVATLSVSDPRTLMISPWQQPLIPEIEKGILNAHLGLNPINDGKLIRIPIPALTEERRRELAKVIKTHAEEARVAVRHARRDANDECKKLEKDGEMTEDEVKKASNQIQKLTDDFITKIDEAATKKEQEIMTM